MSNVMIHSMLRKCFIFIIFSMGIILVGCTNKTKFVGEWKASLYNGENCLKLYENGDYTWYQENALVPYEEGEWKIKGDSLCMNNRRIDATGGFFLKFYVIRVNEHQLFLKDHFRGIMEFEKSSKSF